MDILKTFFICATIGVIAWFAGDIYLKSTKQKVNQPQFVTLASGEKVEIADTEVTPKSTEYTGKGIYYKRTVEGARFMSPFGLSPGELAGSQKPFQFKSGSSPEVDVTPDGVNAGKSSGSTFTGGASDINIFAKIWSHVKDYAIIAGIILLVIVVAPVFVPALKPMMDKIIEGFKNFLTFILPGGGLTQWWEKSQLKKGLTQIVQGGDAFLDGVVADSKLPDDVKEYIINMYKTKQNVAQDEATKAKVDEAQGK